MDDDRSPILIRQVGVNSVVVSSVAIVIVLFPLLLVLASFVDDLNDDRVAMGNAALRGGGVYVEGRRHIFFLALLLRSALVFRSVGGRSLSLSPPAAPALPPILILRLFLLFFVSLLSRTALLTGLNNWARLLISAEEADDGGGGA